MEAVYVLGGFGLSSIFYAVGGYLNELCIYLDNMGLPGFFQKVLVSFQVTCIYPYLFCAYRLLPTPEPFVKAHGKILAEG